MVTELSELKSYKEAMDCKEHSLPYQFDSIFNDSKWLERGLSKNKFKLLSSVDSLLKKILQSDEQVFYISWGVKSSFIDQFFSGSLMYYINRKAFVFTTNRIILVQLKGKFKIWELVSQIPYKHVSKIKQTLFGNLKIFFTNDESSLFVHMPKIDRKKIPVISDTIHEKIGTELIHGGVDNLCPHCFAVVEQFPAQCDICKKPFKSVKKAGFLSLLFPGLGDLYLGHRLIGCIEILAAFFLWFSIIASGNESGEPTTALEMAISVSILFVIMHGADALVTFNTAKKGIYPAK